MVAPDRMDGVMEDSWRPGEIRVLIPSSLEYLELVDRVAEGFARMVGFDEEAASGIAIAVSEAGTNAVQHGHGYDPTRPVLFVFKLKDLGLEVSVRDEGPGFDPEKVLDFDPSEPENLLRPRGRGIFIMRSLMDEVSFDTSPGAGCTARLRKALPAR